MKTIKIIDLLNKIAKGEELPQRIKYDDYIWILREQFNDYWNDEQYLFIRGFDIYEDAMFFINDKVEIIEEEKEIEKLDVALLGQCDNWLRCPTNEVTKKDVELNPYIIDNIRENTLYFQRKINELIDEVNELKRGN